MGRNTTGMSGDNTKSVVDDTNAGRSSRKKASDTAARRERRQSAAKLQTALAEKRCVHCLAVGCWRVDRTAGRIRYLVCGACGKRDQLAI